MQTPVASLLLITSAVILTCLVIDYSIIVVQTTLQSSDSPTINKLRNIQNSLLNQTDTALEQAGIIANQTSAEPTDPPTP